MMQKISLSLLVLIVFAAPINADDRVQRFDFGAGPAEKGFLAVELDDVYTADRGYGWTRRDNIVLRDRHEPDPLRRDYVFGRAPAQFRIDLPPGVYRMTLIMGDMEFGDHVLAARVNAPDVKLPVLRAQAAQFATLTAAFEIADDHLLLDLDSPVNNWVINALMLEPAEKPQKPAVSHEQFAWPMRDTWADVPSTPDPTAPLLAQFRADQREATIEPTGLTRGDYLHVIAGNVDYFRQQQDDRGAIIDPHRNVEFQYSTPCFALAAATLVVHAGREDLLEPAAKAMDWSCHTLKQRKAATAHEDFYPPPIAHALMLLEGRVDPARYQRWQDDIRSFEPRAVYRSAPGAGNWNVVALSGEYLFFKLRLRDDLSYVEQSLAAQGRHFAHPHGLYTEGPMPYDHFPRLWAAGLIAHGYEGVHAANLYETLRRAAITSMFMQSPSGELPTGGRSSHHQWNEAQQCVTYEIFAARAKADGDEQLAGAYKRAAMLALASMKRWMRPSGEMWIIKNRLEPAKYHGYEGYSSHSQYNLLPMAMLAIAYEHAAATEDVKELPAPADVGGFVLDLRPVFGKIFASASGCYVQIETSANPSFEATGLVRMHHPRMVPQLGPSDSLSEKAVYQLPPEPRTTAAVGVAWRDRDGQWTRLAGFTRGMLDSVELHDVKASPRRVEFELIYRGDLGAPDRIIERYVITPQRVEQTTDLQGYDGPVQLIWPVLSDIGDEKTRITIADTTVSVSLWGSTQTFTAPDADSVRIEEPEYPFHNGFARLAVAEFPRAQPATLILEPQPGD
jgi:hypothetical protein